MPALADYVTFHSARERETVEKLLHNDAQQVLWATRPNPGLWSCTNLLQELFFGYVLLFIVIWTGYALGLLPGSEGVEPSQRFCALLLTFFFGSISLAALAHPWLTRRRLRRSLYVLTARRALLLEPGFFGWRHYSWALNEGLLLARHEEPGGGGSLRFSSACSCGRLFSRDGWYGLADVRLAEEKLRFVLLGLTSASSRLCHSINKFGGVPKIFEVSSLVCPLRHPVWAIPSTNLVEGNKMAAALGVETVDGLAGAVGGALSPAERQELESVLLRGEHLCWLERPVACVEWRGNLRTLASGLFALGSAFVFTWGCWRLLAESGAGAGLLLLACFTLMLYGWGVIEGLRPFWRRWQLARSLYVLTDRRAVIVEAFCSRFRTHAYPLKPRMVLSRMQKKDGSGDLVFEEVRASRAGHDVRRGFLHLPDLCAAEAELEKVIRNVRP